MPTTASGARSTTTPTMVNTTTTSAPFGSHERREEEEAEGTSGQMEESEQGRSQFIARRGKAKRRLQLIQKLKRRRRSKYRGQDAFPRDALFTVPSSHASWKRAYRKLNRRPSHATEIIIMTGHDEKTVHCQASLTAIKQRRSYPDKNSGRPHQRHVTNKAWQVRHQCSEII